ncbi:TPA: hypothetical protein HA278_02810 [Candidatus Woesearchaeota archaeon]|jgi:hypothetical protein|nr:hypothetical protein [archaeon]HIJ10964.1 hypothetical protein [Candidatus Woesearchaeota archaeon]|tara:strand:- start:161 stop:457 length:297 start_codon:yes stop_codon:yes gene_type:complete
MTKSKEIQRIARLSIPILKRNKVVKAGIFGSYATGKPTKKSDIDMLVKINNPKLSLLGVIELQQTLERKLGTKVDLVEYNEINHLLRERILQEEVRIL